MLKLDTILFPTDFSECAEHAFAQAAALARRFDATLHVLNVAVPMANDPDDPMAYLRDLDVEPEAVARAYRAEGLRVVPDQIVGFSEAQGILEYAVRIEADLIVMGTHGRRGVGRLLLGSVAEQVARLAEAPVLTVGAAHEVPRPLRRFLVPVDFSDSTPAALAHAVALAEAFGAYLDVLHVVSEVSLPGVYGIEPVLVAVPDVQARVREALVRETETAAGTAVPYDVHVLVGFPARDIADFAALQQTDLIVLSTHGRTGLRRLLMGSVAENVIRLAPCAVLTLKSFGRSLLAPPPAVPTLLAAPTEEG